jgi:hypothetical protein
MRKVTITNDEALKGILPSADEDVVVIHDGHAVALVTMFDDDDLQWYAQERDPAFIESLRVERGKIAAGQAISHDELIRKLAVKSTDELLADLVDERGAVGIDAAEGQVPDEPGFYAVFVDDPQALPDFVGQHLRERQTKLLYVGVASRSLRKRLLEQDLQHENPSIFFRTLGAVLHKKPQPGSLRGRTNQQNYFFSDEDTRSIVDWIDAHLRIKWLVAHCSKVELEAIERSILRRMCPAFNLNHNPQRIERVEELRKECRRLATGGPDCA